MKPSEDDIQGLSQRTMKHFPGLERLVCAALADPTFAAALLHDPDEALRRSALDLELTAVEYEMVIATRSAHDIHDFAARLYQRAQQSTSE